VSSFFCEILQAGLVKGPDLESAVPLGFPVGVIECFHGPAWLATQRATLFACHK
jgi:hypothetical protein